MAALTQTAANVKLGGTGTLKAEVTAGETISQGMPVYLKTSDGKYWKADADTAAEALVAGIALTPGVANDQIMIVKGGPMNVGGTLTVGMGYYVHTTAGAMGEIGELASGDFPTFLGFATTAAILQVQIVVATVAKA